jgi:hypothetical protein
MSLHTQANLLRSMGVPSIWKDGPIDREEMAIQCAMERDRSLIRVRTSPGQGWIFDAYMNGTTVEFRGAKCHVVRHGYTSRQPIQLDLLLRRCEPVVIKPEDDFTTCGKQVLKDGADFCQAKDEEAAREIADAMNGRGS